MGIELKTIGFVRTDAEKLPRHWSVSEVEGTLAIDEEYSEGLRDIEPGQRIVVIFHFHQSPEFQSTAEQRRRPPSALLPATSSRGGSRVSLQHLA